jgi:hypothetical protein
MRRRRHRRRALRRRLDVCNFCWSSPGKASTRATDKGFGQLSCTSLLDKPNSGEHAVSGPSAGGHPNQSNEDMDSYPSRCPIEANSFHRTFNQSTGIAPDASRRASVGRA